MFLYVKVKMCTDSERNVKKQIHTANHTDFNKKKEKMKRKKHWHISEEWKMEDFDSEMEENKNDINIFV